MSITEIAGSARLANLESSDNSLSYIAQGPRGADGLLFTLFYAPRYT